MYRLSKSIRYFRLKFSKYIQLKGIYNLTFKGRGGDVTVYGGRFLIRNSPNGIKLLMEYYS